MNVLSLFDGISTGRYCLAKAGIPVEKYYASEIDESAIKISEKNYPDIIRLGDVTKIHASDLAPIDLIIGGSPCQGFSKAGAGLNFEDPRSKLFFEYVRLLNEIREYNPGVKFLLENVVMRTEYEDIISEYMGVKPYKINSRYFSAQHRERLYWTNIPVVRYGKERLYYCDEADEKLLDVLDTSYVPNIIHEANGVLFGPGVSANGKNLVRVVNGAIQVKQATKQGYIVANVGDGLNLEFPGSQTRRGRVIPGKSHTLTVSGRPLVLDIHNIIRQFTTLERERLQKLPDGYTECPGVTDAQRNKALGNGWTASVITHIFGGLTP